MNTNLLARRTIRLGMKPGAEFVKRAIAVEAKLFEEVAGSLTRNDMRALVAMSMEAGSQISKPAFILKGIAIGAIGTLVIMEGYKKFQKER